MKFCFVVTQFGLGTLRAILNCFWLLTQTSTVVVDSPRKDRGKFLITPEEEQQNEGAAEASLAITGCSGNGNPATASFILKCYTFTEVLLIDT